MYKGRAYLSKHLPADPRTENAQINVECKQIHKLQLGLYNMLTGIIGNKFKNIL